MAEEPRLNALQRYQRIQQKLTSVAKSLAFVMQQPGATVEILNGAADLDERKNHLNSRVAQEWKTAQQSQGTPSQSLDDLALDVDTLLAEVHEFHRDATTGASLAQLGTEAIELNRHDFANALDYHQKQSWLALILIAIALTAGFGALAYFFNPDDVKDLRSGDWGRIAVLLGGRGTIVLGLAWVVNFLGKLQRQHSQQAVAYRDKLGGLDTAKALLLHGSADERKTVIDKMTAAYLSMEGNAFAPVPSPEKGYKLGELNKLAKTFGNLAVRVIDKTRG